MTSERIRLLETAAAGLDAFTAAVGGVAAYLTLATVVICFANVYLRYALGIGHVWLQESYVWTHAAAIMFGSGYALLQGGFVRVDTFYNRFSDRGRAWIDLVGTVAFMAPFLWMMAAYGWPFFYASWQIGERSAYETGLAGIYLLKGTLLVFVFLVAVQGLAIVCRCLLTLLAGVPLRRVDNLAAKEGV